MSLYRTYRPKAFADVIGQDHIVTTLEQSAKNGKLAHAYLFAGSRGTGKTSVARILAKTMMTQGITDETLKAQIEQGVDDSSIVDLLEIDAASNRGIDDIRDLVEKIQFSPIVATAKVYIVDEVHMLTKEAFNALLKTLEEPPAYAYFILATTELNKIPATIQSRCQSFPFRQIRTEDIIRRLQYIADTEKITIDREALRAIALHSEGGMRDAISLLDQLRSLENITVEEVQLRVGATGHEQAEKILQAIEDGNAQDVLTTIKEVEEAGIPFDIFLRGLLETVRQSLHTNIEGNTSTEATLQIFNTLLTALRDIRIAPLPALVVESALVGLCSGTTTTAQAAPAKVQEAPAPKPPKPEKVEQQPEIAAQATPDEAPPPPAPEPAAAESPKTIIEAKELTVDALKAVWNDIVKKVQPASIRMSLKDSRVQGLDGNTVTLSFGSSFHRDKVADASASRAVEEVLTEAFSQAVKIECAIETHGQAIGEADTEVNIAEAAKEIF